MSLSNLTIDLSFELTPESRAEWAAFAAVVTREAEAQWPAILAQIQETSRLTGLDVKYDLTPFDMPWSPLYRHGSDSPVAWEHNRTGERREGAAMPEEIA